MGCADTKGEKLGDVNTSSQYVISPLFQHFTLTFKTFFAQIIKDMAE